MPIDVIRPTVGTRTTHMVRASTEMVIKEGRGPDGEHMTVYTAMGICGTEATGTIAPTEIAKDVTCQRCSPRAERELAPEPEPMVSGSHGWDDAPVLTSPEATDDPAMMDDEDEADDDPADLPTKQGIHRTAGQIRHGKIRYERSQAKRKMKEQLAGRA